MIKSHEEKIVMTDRVIDDIICNQCEKPIKVSEYTGEFDDCLEVNKSWGHSSRHDTESHTFHMCQDCYDKLIGSFKVPVEVDEVFCYYDDDEESEDESYDSDSYDDFTNNKG